MKALDRYLRDVRISKARPFVRKGDVVVDIGCADGVMFRRWDGLIWHGIGVDPTLEILEKTAKYELYPGYFPQDLPAGIKCDVITMLAVLEHLPPDVQSTLADSCHRMLNDNGRVVITVPSPRVDDVLNVLDKLKLIDGMSLHEHYGFDPTTTPSIFPEPRFRMIKRRSFQLGLNNLFVFEKKGA